MIFLENFSAKLASFIGLPAAFGTNLLLVYVFPAQQYIQYTFYMQLLLFISIPFSSVIMHSLRHDYATSLFQKPQLFAILSIIEISTAILIFNLGLSANFNNFIVCFGNK